MCKNRSSSFPSSPLFSIHFSLMYTCLKSDAPSWLFSLKLGGPFRVDIESLQSTLYPRCFLGCACQKVGGRGRERVGEIESSQHEIRFKQKEEGECKARDKTAADGMGGNILS